MRDRALTLFGRRPRDRLGVAPLAPDSISKRWTFRIKDLTCDGEKQHRVCRKVDARFSTKRGHPQDQADLDPHRQHTPTVNDRLESLFTLRGIRTQADISKERRASYADQSSTGE